MFEFIQPAFEFRIVTLADGTLAQPDELFALGGLGRFGISSWL
jgi:hypothetical protein